jgi:LysM repeat protein
MNKYFTITAFLLAFGITFVGGQAKAAVTHKVRTGDTLQKISKKYNVSIDKLKVLNDLRTTALKRGQVLTVDTEPATAKSAKVRQQAKQKKGTKKPLAVVEKVADEENENPEYIEYKVQRGDTIEKLARQFNIDKEELVELNDIGKRRLKPGALVFIPKAGEDSEDAPLPLRDRPLNAWRNEDERGILVKVAKSFSGAPYRYGGESVRGLDCSAFVKKMYEIFEVQLPRSAREQFHAGQKVNKEELTTGDLVFFKTKRYVKYPTHVGIYIGEDMFIHASSLLRRGVKVDSLNGNYFSRTYVGAVRVKAPPTAERTEENHSLHKSANDT